MASQYYRFDRFELDALSRELRHDGSAVALPLKSFDCLVYLLERRDRAVGRDELISAVWGRVDVSDALLGQTLARARRAVDDSGGEQRVIRTVPRFGYRWVAPVEVIDAAPPVAVAPRTQDVAPADTMPAGEDEPAALATEPMDAPVRPAPVAPWRRRLVRAALAVVLVAALAVAAVEFAPRREPPSTAAAAATANLVLPVEVADPDPQSHWIRLGAMDYLASRLRERGRLAVLPSDRTIAFLATRGDASATAPAERQRIAAESGAERVFAATARHLPDGWTFELDVQDAERTTRYSGVAATPLQAADRALAGFLAGIGIDGEAAPPQRPTLVELQQRIDAAFLESDLRTAAELIEAAPPELQRDAQIAVRAAEIDERAGRTDQAERGFARIAGDTDASAVVRGRAQYGLCAVAYRKNDLTTAQARCGDALAALGGDADPMLLGRAHMLRGVIDDQLGRTDEALAAFGLARIEWRRAGNLPGEASVDVDEGLALARGGRLADAVALFDRAIGVLQRLGVNDHLASALAAKSDAQRTMLDLDGALASSAEAWRLATRVESARAVRAIGYSRVLVLLAAGRLDEAARVLDRFDAASPDAAPEFAVQQRVLLAERGRYAEATAGAEAVLDRAAAPPDPTSDASLSEAAAVLGDAALRGGDLDLARRVLSRLQAAGAAAQDPDRGFVADLLQARIAAAAADDATADARFTAALQSALRSTYPDRIVAVASAYVGFLLERERLADATQVGARLALYVDRDHGAAQAMAALYERLGDARSAQQAREAAARLAGERVPPPHPAG
ncbi:winged helix-turn-helix domain-containing protein [Dokdonella ginsengisoli]|uniref:Winged helix-turn-helix domain-containing protein n=1 Tax=Dokdonella ginsengisoli TaxID=363846 RepID=A0ABV9QV30_9GAMM